MTREQLSTREYQQGSILLGRDDDGRYIGAIDDAGNPEDRHIVTVAGSRAGKSSTCLKPNLALWPSSALVIDPKGELATETAARRAAMGQDVYILDPFNEVKGAAQKWRATYDPLSEIKAGKPDDMIDNAALIADALIVPDKDAKSDHWTLSAKNLLRGFILWALHRDLNHGQTASLVDVREWITAPQGDDEDDEDDEVGLDTLFALMGNTEAFSGVLAGVGNTMKGKPKGEKGSIISTAVEQTAFLDSEPMQTHLAGEDLRPLPSLRILKQKPTTIYLVLPASRMGTHFRWLRTILTLALATLENEPHQLGKDAPVLFVLEEFPQLGYMRQIEAAAGLMAGYQVKLWSILQDLSQLKSLYRDSWETFIGNAGVIQAFGNTDATTLEYISRSLGNLQIMETQPTFATPSNVGGGGLTERENSKGVPLLAPFEIAQFAARDTQRQIILFAGQAPAYIQRLTHEEVSKIGS
ncbi:type IV secretory system conjugative DNA transfer family protein [Tateyamaria sp. syn59]|uniref:type IV secretory system conjugative DNA transfer family protein n=1 Tax=Tateyamaria sp. syn59 TaxID=2576942 RepID=UPI0016765578|nr:type IV secretory system conjugative DNA transfer family protein [Tateyamaria sp. syn59]